MPYRMRAQHALERWRTVDRALARLTEIHPMHTPLEEAREALQAEYEAIVAEARAAGAPEPPPFPAGHELRLARSRQ